MVTISQLEQKAHAVAASIGVEVHHLLTILHHDLNKLLCRAETDATVVPHVLAKAEEAKLAIVAGVNEVHEDVKAEVDKLDAKEDKIEAVAEKVEADIKSV